MAYELIDMNSEEAIIKVIGVGGGGGNAVNHMAYSDFDGVDFICANTDAQALREMDVETVVQLGHELTKGLGAGTNPEIGRAAAEETKERIREVVKGANMIFLASGMGGGTGTGAIPVIAEVAKEEGALTVAVVTKPFDFEGNKKVAAAEKGIAELEKHVDSMIVIPNQKILSVLGGRASLQEAFEAANNVLLDAVRGVTELITSPGLMNLDFSDVKTIMADMGSAIMGTGIASGDNRARDAIEQAIACPLLDNVDLRGAKGILVNITATSSLGINEFGEIGDIVNSLASEDAVIKVGTAIDPDFGDDLKVTVVATGMNDGFSVGVSSVTLAQKVAIGEVNFDALEKPTILRKDKKKLKKHVLVRNLKKIWIWII